MRQLIFMAVLFSMVTQASAASRKHILPAETRAKMRYPDAAEQYLTECCSHGAARGAQHGSGGGAGKVRLQGSRPHMLNPQPLPPG